MTSKERLLRLFEGKELDRVPIWLLAPYHLLPYYADIYTNPCYAELLPDIAKHCDTLDRRRPSMGFCYNANPDIKTVAIATPEKTGTKIFYKNCIFEKYICKQNGNTHVKFYIDDPEQFKSLLAIPFCTVKPCLDIYRKEKAELGEKGLLMMDLGDPLEVLYHLCSAEDFSMWSLTDYDALLGFTDEMYSRVYELYRYFLQNNVGDVFFIVGAEFAGPPLVSPTKFNELSMRYVKGIVDLIREYGKYSIVHYHGNIRKVLSGFSQIAPDAIHTIEAPPIGDCTITQAYEELKKDIILVGNLQYDDLARLTTDEIDEKVRLILDEGKAGRFILSPTAGPYEQQPSPKTIENYRAFIHAGIRYGGFKT